jgi:hypothetical protein
MKTIPFEGKLTEEQKLNIKSWIEALRSGKYKQGEGWLKSNDRFCCLGVCSSIDEKVKEDEVIGFSYPINADASNFCTQYPDEDWFKNRFGFAYKQPVIFGGQDLICLNDNRHSFSIIANVIEACFINRVEIEI